MFQADYFVARAGNEFDVQEVECTEVLVMPYPVRTLINQVRQVENLPNIFLFKKTNVWIINRQLYYFNIS